MVKAAALFKNNDGLFSDGINDVHGSVVFESCVQNGRKGAAVTVHLEGFKRNSRHPMHVHTYGADLGERVGGPSTCVLGGPYNPFGEAHGSAKLHGRCRHAGDLINNIVADNNGCVRVRFFDDLLGDIEDLFGRSIVIHGGVDDEGMGGDLESLKTGNAGCMMTFATIARV